MMTFTQFIERKTAEDFKFPRDCNHRGIASMTQATTRCSLVGGGSHDHVVAADDTGKTRLVTVVPRHRDINPYTCKGIAKDIKNNCW